MAAILPPYVIWREGRPRFQSTVREQAIGFPSHDLRHAGGAWFTFEEACEAGWPIYFEILDCRGYDEEQRTAIVAAAKLGNALRLTPKARPHKRKQAPAGIAAARGRTNEALIQDWLAALERETDPDLRVSPDTIESYRKAVRPLLYKPETRTERADRLERERAAETLGVELAARARELFATKPPEAIDSIALNDLFLALKKERGIYVARAAVAAYSAAWTWGTLSKDWRLGTNPRHGLDLPQPEGRIVIYTDTEIRALIAAAAHTPCGPDGKRRRHSVGDSIMLGLMTCQRQRDRLLLKDEGLVDGRRQVRQSKTKKLVPVKETPQLTARLSEARARNATLFLELGLPADRRAETIVVDETTGRTYEQSSYRHAFADVRALAIAGLRDHVAEARPGRNSDEPIWILPPCPSLVHTLDDGETTLKTDQDLRDTSVTWLARAGATMAEICAISGHSAKSVQTIIRHYLGETRELADAGIDKLVAWMQREGIAV